MKHGTRYRRINRRLTLITVVANVCGAALIAFYFSNIYGDWQGSAIGTVPGLIVLIVATVVLLILGNGLSGRWTAPLWTWHRRLTAEGAEPERAPPEIQRLALNMPAISAGATMGMWLLAGLFFGIFANLDPAARRFDWAGFVQVLVGTEIAGVVTTVLIYFAIEWVWRSELPLFFMEEDLTRTSAFRLRVRGRMLVLFLMSAMPLLDLSILSYSHAVQMANAAQPAALLPKLLRLELFLAGGGILAAVVLARTLGASLVEPLETLSKRMRAVEGGDLDVRMTVASNDEIGVASACFNSMVEGLQRRDVELQTIYQISQDITANLELEQTLQTVLDRVRQMIAYDGAEICLYEEEEKALRVRARAESGRVHIETEGRVCREGEGYAGWIGEHRRSLLVSDVDGYQDRQPATRQLAGGAVLKSYLGVPLLAGQRMVGTLELAGACREMFDEHARQLLETIAPQAAIAIDNAVQVLERERRLKEQIEQLRIQIDEAKLARQVAEITETEYFQQLQKKARRIRGTPDDSSE